MSHFERDCASASKRPPTVTLPTSCRAAEGDPRAHAAERVDRLGRVGLAAGAVLEDAERDAVDGDGDPGLLL
jgi:hypothetical protein